MSIQAQFTDLFICPISYERMRDPFINTCGHTFERLQIEGWRARKVAEGSVPNCPLCQSPLAQLIPNILLKQALEVMDDPQNIHLPVEELTDEEQEVVQRAIHEIRSRRASDQSRGILDRLPVPQNYIQALAAKISGFYGCS